MKIVVSDIPGYYKKDYSEQLYLTVRSVDIFRESEFIESADKFKIKNDNVYSTRKIQSIFYDKYSIEFITTENIDIGILEIAGKITITQDNGEIHNARIVNLSEPEKLQNTSFLKYNIIYIDLNSKEVVNHLTYDSVNNTDYIADLVLVIFGEFKFFNTKIYPEFSITPYEIEENTDNKIQIISSENAFKTIKLFFYLTESEKNYILENMNYNLLLTRPPFGGSSIYIEYDSNVYIPIELPTIEIEDSELENLYPITVTMKYEQILNYPYE